MLTFCHQTFPASEITQRYHEDFYRSRDRDGYIGYYVGEDQRIYREELLATIDSSSYYGDDNNDSELAVNDGISTDDDSSMLSYFNIGPDEMPSNDYLNDPVFIQRFRDYSDAIRTETHSSDENYYTATSPITDSNDSAANTGVIRRWIGFILSPVVMFLILFMIRRFLFLHNYEDVVVREPIIDSASSYDDETNTVPALFKAAKKNSDFCGLKSCQSLISDLKYGQNFQKIEALNWKRP
ncbi:hypothetical protein BD770DRAFT_241453 [Pilaira anomala]|nr:hypothetical protein BD770DRAFT_241453 [Pilaira anomala]